MAKHKTLAYTEKCPPVLFLIFNRPDLTRRVFARIREAKPSKIFIAADGPRKDFPGEDEICAQTRLIVDEIDWPCELQTLFRDENLGCKMAVSSAISWFFSHVEQGIILEDDCLPEPEFFEYCFELLERYRYDHKVMSINGFNFGYHPETSLSYSFTRYMNMWGWATWRRSMHMIDYNIVDWKYRNKSVFLYTRLRSSLFDFDWKWVKNWRKKFDELIEKNVDTWDYQWVYAGLKYRLYSIVPHRNLIRNIGFDDRATHTIDSENLINKTETAILVFPMTYPKKIIRNVFYEEQYVKKIWQSYFRKSFKYQLWLLCRDVFRPER